MLSRKERTLLACLHERCSARGGCLIMKEELLRLMQKKTAISAQELERLLKDLESDDYVDVVESERDDLLYYCVTLHTKGVYYKREIENLKRQIFFKVVLTVATALLGVLITKGLIALF